MDRRKKTLRDAMKFEMDGREFFIAAAERTSDYFGKIIFNSLADEELKHIETIKVIDRSLREKGEWPFTEDHDEKGRENIFEAARMEMDEIVKDRTDDLEAVKIAMDFEQKGYRFYSFLAEEATDWREQEFYQRLASEEQMHLLILEDTWRTLVEYSSSSLG
ncbi:MAG: hypothetical protein GTN74_07760 [Proteobacteria bacterium]|nr:hypothetical protein [Pseudomonadota bacterium]